MRERKEGELDLTISLPQIQIPHHHHHFHHPNLTRGIWKRKAGGTAGTKEKRRKEKNLINFLSTVT